MEIQTEKERDPAVGNIIRDSPETQVDTEIFENSFGVKTAKESGIRTLHENEDDAKDDTENDEDDSDNGGAQRKPKNKKPVRPEKGRTGIMMTAMRKAVRKNRHLLLLKPALNFRNVMFRRSG